MAGWSNQRRPLRRPRTWRAQSCGTRWSALGEGAGQARLAFRGLHQRNNRVRAKRNVASHYDLDQRLYNLFLDSDRQYSCAYFEFPGQSLEDAQTAKRRHLAAKLLAKEGSKTLDIGCGFGGLALYLAGVAGARVTGAPDPKSSSQSPSARARETGLAEKVEFRLQDDRGVPRHSTGSSRSACSSTSAQSL